tara:strand:- start:8139 stop:8591 length:453 start_codon:yes stop_codon:yes gene_type:complete
MGQIGGGNVIDLTPSKEAYIRMLKLIEANSTVEEDVRWAKDQLEKYENESVFISNFKKSLKHPLNPLNKNSPFTNLEKNFIEYFLDTEYGEGCGHVFHYEWDMHITRGVMSSLVKKKVLTAIDDDFHESDYPSTWVAMDMDLLRKMGVVE